jgi:hypothetical protein
MVGYIQNHVVGAIAGRDIVDRPVFLDGFSVQWWESGDTFSRAMRSPEWDAVRVDDATIFSSASRGTSAALRPRVIKDGPRLPFKVVWFARFLPHLDPQEASDHWLNHGSIAIESGEVGRYIQNLVIGGIGKDGSIAKAEKVRYDGFSERWFADRAAYERAVASEPWARLERDAATLFDMAAMANGMSAVLEERVIRDPES